MTPQKPLADRLHPTIAKSALAFARGNQARVVVVSYTHAQVVLQPRK